MHIVLVEPHFAGHRPTYLLLYSRLLIDMGHSVSVISGEVTECKRFLNENVKLGSVNVVPLIEAPKRESFLSGFSFYDRYLLWRRLGRSLKALKNVDFVFFMYFDYFVFNFNDVRLLRFGINKFLNKYILPSFIADCIPYRWSGILFQPSSVKSSVVLPFFKFKHHSSVCLLDETWEFEDEVRNKFYLPDVTDQSRSEELTAMAKDVLKKARGRKIISLLGSLEKRKGLLPLLDVVLQMDPEKYYFLIAGKMDVTFTDEDLVKIEFLQKNGENCYLKTDGIPTETDFNCLVNISDIVYLVYSGFYHSSNLMTKASIFSKPVMVSEGYCMAKRVRLFNTGIVLTDCTCDRIKHAIENFDDLYIPSEARFSEYFSMHSQEKLRQVLPHLFSN